MPKDSKSTPIPPAVQAKMQQGLRQRYATGTTGTTGNKPKDERK